MFLLHWKEYNLNITPEILKKCQKNPGKIIDAILWLCKHEAKNDN